MIRETPVGLRASFSFPPSLSHLEASRAVLGLAAAARGATAAEGDESGIPKMPLIGRARRGVVRPDQGQKVTGLGGSQAKTNKQYSGQIQAILAAAPPGSPNTAIPFTSRKP